MNFFSFALAAIAVKPVFRFCVVVDVMKHHIIIIIQNDSDRNIDFHLN